MARSSRPAPAVARQPPDELASGAQSEAEIDATMPRVALRSAEGELAAIQHAALAEAAMRWSYIVRNRERWAGETVEADLSASSRRQLAKLGVTDAQFEALSRADLVEVVVPYVEEAVGWEARGFPWEYVLTACRAPGSVPLTVVRHLARAGHTLPDPVAPRKLLMVESAPGTLRAHYAFGAELRLIGSKAGDIDTLRTLVDPTPEQLAAEVAAVRPDAIHLAGCDNHEAADLLGRATAGEVRDGYAMAGGDPYVAAEPLAALLAPPGHAPRLVACNFWNSAARTAALVVAAGAEAAVGFQDYFDDGHAELFYAQFYENWWRSSGETHTAFLLALDQLRASYPLAGCGVVLWSRRSVFADDPAAVPVGGQRRRRPSGAVAPDAAEPAWKKTLEVARNTPIGTGGGPGGSGPGGNGPGGSGPGGGANPTGLTAAQSSLQVDVVPRKQMNYSMLHNRRGLFERFRLRKLKTGLLPTVTVEVLLYGGVDSHPFKQSFALDADVLDLTDKVHVPLVSAVGRALREGVRTTLFVEVCCGDTLVSRETHPITLLAVDEWRDDDLDRVWLPSFVLPRDPAVWRITDAAQRFLRVLSDDFAAGFDGYQSIAPAAAPLKRDFTGVDLQVQALWASLQHEFPLGYINPPPTFTAAAQRLRAPSDVLAEKRGTCLDLALLLAACLEHVDIHPVLFLLKGHAFVGYWRDDAAYASFVKGSTPPAPTTPTAPGRPATPARPIEPWYLGRDYFDEVVQWVNRRALVPLEAVFLTGRHSYAEALAEGLKNLRSRAEFDAVIDVRLAREKDVIPLPIHREPDR